MKNILNKIIIMFVLWSQAVVVFAIEYVPLEPNAFPGINTSGTSGDLGAFLGQVFNFGIAAAVTLAFIMIIWGGIEMMSSDSWTKKDGGKKKIWDAIWGLLIALISWLLLYTINPDLVNFSGNLLLGK